MGASIPAAICLTRKTVCATVALVAATIRDVAREAGVSVTTVSHALSGRRPVSTQTRRRIDAVSRRLAYRPSHLAQAMVTGRSQTIGLIVPDIANPFFPGVARGVEDTAADRGYSVFLADSELDQAEEQRYVDLFEDKGVDGLIYLAGTPLLGPALTRVAASQTPLVLVDEELQLEGPNCGFVGVDNHHGGQLAARHLASCKAGRVGVIAGPPALPTAIARLDGFLAGLAEAGGAPTSIVNARSYTYEDGCAAFAELHARAPALDALFCANDMLALGAISAARGAGLDVPRDLSVIGFDNIFFGRLANPGLTTVAQPMDEIGREAANVLIDLIEGRETQQRRVLPVHLVTRSSTRLEELPDVH
jgi:LacI family transcriptional regulator